MNFPIVLQAFQKNSSLTNDMSISILSLEESGRLQELKDKWLGAGDCGTRSSSTVMKFESYAGLGFIIVGVYILCILISFICYRCNINRHQQFHRMNGNQNL